MIIVSFLSLIKIGSLILKLLSKLEVVGSINLLEILLVSGSLPFLLLFELSLFLFSFLLIKLL
jgi:hypothetical protein